MKVEKAGVSPTPEETRQFSGIPKRRWRLIVVPPRHPLQTSHSQLTSPAMLSLLMKLVKSTVGVQGSF